MAGRVDTSELRALADAFRSAGSRLRPEVERVTLRTANKVRDEARSLIRGQSRGKYLKHYPNAITAEMTDTGSTIAAEIGPDSSRPQGGMGRGAEFGSVHTGPKTHMFPALDSQEDPYVDDIGDVAVKALLP